MPTRKQKRRVAKSKRHEYEFVYVDDDGNEVEAPPEPAPSRSSNGAKAAPKKTATPARTQRMRTPPEPSWRRAARRAVILGAVVFVLFAFTSKSYVTAVVPAAIYTVLFIPFTFAIDRFAYRRYQARQQQPPTTKKR